MHSTTSKTHGEKIALAAGSLTALAFAPTGADAAIIHVTGQPVSLSLDVPRFANAAWDIDSANGNGAEFYLWHLGDPNHGSVDMARGTAGGYNGLNLGHGKAFVIKNGFHDWSIQGMAAGLQVGPTLAAGYHWNTGASDWMSLLATSHGNSHSIGPGVDTLALGDNLIGFSFTSGADTLFGWANLNLNVFLSGLTLASNAEYVYSPQITKTFKWDNTIYTTVLGKVGITLGTGFTMDMPEQGTKTKNYNVYNQISYRLSRVTMLNINSRYTKVTPGNNTTLEIAPSITWRWRTVFVDLEASLKKDKTSGSKTTERKIMLKVTRPFRIL